MRISIALYAALLNLVWLHSAVAQKDTLQLKDLSMPTAPAFSLLDQAPSVVDRPASARAFTLGLFQSIDQKAGLPTNYAVEATPYWFVKHKTMSFTKFYGTDNLYRDKVSFPWTKGLALRASLSVAYVNPANSTQATANALAEQNSVFSFGGRVPLFKVLGKMDLEELHKEADNVIKGLSDVNKAFVAANPMALLLATGTPADVVKYHQLEHDFLVAYKYKAKGNVAGILSRKPVASLDLAFAGSRYFPNRTFAANRAGRTGVWLTGNVSVPFKKDTADHQKAYFSVYLIGRYLTDKALSDTTKACSYLDITYADAGGKLELEFSRIIFSYELVSRKVGGADKEKNPLVGDGWRSVGNIKFRINTSTFITGAFGKNFGVRDNLLYSLGVNWNIQTESTQASTP
jgi:hypothetical protein